MKSISVELNKWGGVDILIHDNQSLAFRSAQLSKLSLEEAEDLSKKLRNAIKNLKITEKYLFTIPI